MIVGDFVEGFIVYFVIRLRKIVVGLVACNLHVSMPERSATGHWRIPMWAIAVGLDELGPGR